MQPITIGPVTVNGRPTGKPFSVTLLQDTVDGPLTVRIDDPGRLEFWLEVTLDLNQIRGE